MITAGGKRVLVDADVDFLDSVCFGALLMEARKVQSIGGRLAICSHRAKLQELFRSVKRGLPWILFDNQETALCYVVYGTDRNETRAARPTGRA